MYTLSVSLRSLKRELQFSFLGRCNVLLTALLQFIYGDEIEGQFGENEAQSMYVDITSITKMELKGRVNVFYIM